MKGIDMPMKMLYKKNDGVEPEVVQMLSCYRGPDGKLKAIIFRDIKDADSKGGTWKVNPYDEVKLAKLRPLLG